MLYTKKSTPRGFLLKSCQKQLKVNARAGGECDSVMFVSKDHGLDYLKLATLDQKTFAYKECKINTHFFLLFSVNFALLAGFIFVIGATIRIGREMPCLPCAGFLSGHFDFVTVYLGLVLVYFGSETYPILSTISNTDKH